MSQIRTALFALAILNILFVLFAMIFSGSWHALDEASAGFHMEYISISALLLLSAGILITLTKKYWLAFIICPAALILLLAGYFLYWRNIYQAAAAGVVIVVVGTVSFFITKFFPSFVSLPAGRQGGVRGGRLRSTPPVLPLQRGGIV